MSNSTDIFENSPQPKEPILTALDILNDERELEEEASALFGNFENNICTYEKGYMNRQPLYSCLTCRENEGETAGICLACSLNCHENHNLVELYTKRNFKCDCGNSKFKDKCLLCPDKDEINSDNIYNHNFEGVYCTCNRPYPDDENENEEEMIQCIVCEDWFHTNHISSTLDNTLNTNLSNDFEEFTCIACVEKHPFLMTYQKHIAPQTIGNDKSDIDNVTVSTISPIKNICPFAALEHDDDQKNEGKTISLKPQPIFWPTCEWRKILCQCVKCLKMYEDRHLTFLPNAKDTLIYFTQNSMFYNTENKPVTSFTNILQSTQLATNESIKNTSTLINGHTNEIDKGDNLNVNLSPRTDETNAPLSNNFKSQYEQSLEAFSHLDRMSQNTMIHEFNDMKDKLKDYFKRFADENKVVTKEDVAEFFTHQLKRPKTKDFEQYN